MPRERRGSWLAAMLPRMNAMNIGQRVRQARQARDLTIEHLARRADLSLSAVSELERDCTRRPLVSCRRSSRWRVPSTGRHPGWSRLTS
jgi:ribosome-binding protein aMBF1 (putative translation factor)